MSGSVSPMSSGVGWSAPTEEDCPQVERNVINGGLRSLVRQVCGYFNGEFSYFSYEYAQWVEKKEVILARVWTEGRAVLHATFDEHGAELSRSVVGDLTCQADVVRSNPDAARLAVSYLNTYPEGR